jgi:hypothetical protein
LPHILEILDALTDGSRGGAPLCVTGSAAGWQKAESHKLLGDTNIMKATEIGSYPALANGWAPISWFAPRPCINLLNVEDRLGLRGLGYDSADGGI